jgi:hypothetical protein
MKNPLYRSKPYFSGGNLPQKTGNAASRAIGMKNGHCGTQGTRVRFTMFTLTGSSLGKSRALTAACWRHICDRQISILQSIRVNARHWLYLSLYYIMRYCCESHRSSDIAFVVVKLLSSIVAEILLSLLMFA